MTQQNAIRLLAESLRKHKYPANYLDLLLEYCDVDFTTADETPLSASQHATLSHTLWQLSRDVPVEYIIGKAYFYGQELLVSPSVLIPRPFTEEVVVTVLSERLKYQEGMTIIDIATGSGAIILATAATLKKDFPKIFKKTQFIATDISKNALTVAEQNAVKLKLASRIEFIEADTFPIDNATLLDTFAKRVVIVSNPPYIYPQEYAKLAPSVRLYEPELALVRNEGVFSRIEDFGTILRAREHVVTTILEDGKAGKAFIRVEG
jgi:release factor glutamine methyltransferase